MTDKFDDQQPTPEEIAMLQNAFNNHKLTIKDGQPAFVKKEDDKPTAEDMAILQAAANNVVLTTDPVTGKPMFKPKAPGK